MRFYTPSKTGRYEEKVKAAFLSEARRVVRWNGGVRLSVFAHIPMPKSWTEETKRKMVGLPHLSKPDLDNIIKSIKDGLNKIAWEDDSYVYAYNETDKRWAFEGKTVVVVDFFE